MKRITLLLLMGMTVAGATLSQTPATSPAVAPGAGASAGASVMTDGEVRKVDKSAKKITLRHGPIQNLDMPAMTMVFQVPDAALLDGLAVGDKLRFHAEQQNGAFVVTRVEKVGG
ncbi:MAG: copper-binding protein [Burkholderiaceae bacterium]|nr:copper-binding protein [Burkholderiaceae bacterium]